MNGMDAVACAFLDCDVKIVTGVPGFPITDLMEKIRNKIKNEWSVNEKVALEVALGSSICGQRSAVITKHVGMNILADPLVTSATHTIGAGVVIIAGDDAGVQKSQNEQDSRFYGLIAEVPVFDPSTPMTAYQSVCEAFELSEHVKTPVIIRVTHRMLESTGDIDRINKKRTSPVTFDKKIWHLTMLGKHQHFHKKSLPEMRDHSENSVLNSCTKKGRSGIISSGFASSLVDSLIPPDFSHLALGTINPLPFDLVNRFIDEHERILIVEETESVIEGQISRRVLGKLTGHMPFGIAEAWDIKKAIENIDKDVVFREITPQTIEERGARPICDDCPFLPLYKAVKEMNVPVAGDLGCSILASAPPLSLLDAAFSLGSSIATASGFNMKGIAIIGDYGLAHSGLSGLINAVHNKHDLVAIVLQNKVSAMTGGQEVPDLSELVKSYIKDVEVMNLDGKIDILKILKKKMRRKGISVILARGWCPRY